MPYNALEIAVSVNFIKIRNFNKHETLGRNTANTYITDVNPMLAAVISVKKAKQSHYRP
jgi:hypothetical protein